MIRAGSPDPGRRRQPREMAPTRAARTANASASGSSRLGPASGARSAVCTGSRSGPLTLPIPRGAGSAGGEPAGREASARSIGPDGTAVVVGVPTSGFVTVFSSAACGCATGIGSAAASAGDTDAGNVTATGSTTDGGETGTTSVPATTASVIRAAISAAAGVSTGAAAGASAGAATPSGSGAATGIAMSGSTAGAVSTGASAMGAAGVGAASVETTGGSGATGDTGT